MQNHTIRDRFLALAAVVLSCLTLPVVADPIVSAQVGLSCAASRVGNTMGCTANDFTTTVTIASGASTSCTEGEYFYLSTNVGMVSGNADRYDIAFFSGESGNDPSQLGGICSVATFPASPSPWFSGGGTNTCGDFSGRGTSTPTVQNLRVLCSGDASGQLLLPYTVTWQPNNNSVCTGPADVTPGSTSKCVSGTATLGNVIVKPRSSAYYRFDEASWNGTTGEVKDSSGNALHGTSIDGSTTASSTPAIAGDPGTCRYGYFDGSNDLIQIPHDSRMVGSNALTYTAWINPRTWSGSIRQVMSKSVHGGGSGRAQMGIFSEGGTLKGRAMALNGDSTSGWEVTTSLPSLNAWTHVALVFAGNSLTLYVNGTAASTRSFAATTLHSNTDPFTIGDDYGRDYNFAGLIDEARVYTHALNAAQITAVMNETHPCPVSAAIDHFRFYHDGSGLTCSAENIQVVACSDAACTTQYPTSINATLLPSGWSGGDSQTFTSGATLQLRHNTAGTVALGISSSTPSAANPVRCFIGATQQANCNLTFYDSGFTFDIPNHTADTIQTVIMSAVRKDLTSEQCVPGFQNVSKTVNFWSNYLDPGTGTLVVNLNGSNIATSSPGTGLSLNFDNNGQTTLQVRYPDVGQMRLNASYTGSGAEAGLVMTGEDIFVSMPARFALTIPGNPAAADATGALFRRAGESFTINVEARNASDAITPNYGREAIAESVALTTALVAPLGGSAPALTGNFGPFGQDCAGNPATAGTSCGTFSWPEVGIITLTPQVADSNYLGAGNVTGTVSGNVGRFYPASFGVNHTHNPTCSGAFTYAGYDGPTTPDRLGQPFGVTGSVTARNIAGTTTVNYVGSFVKLTMANITATPRQGAAPATGTLSWGVDSLNFVNGVGTFAENSAQYAFTAESVPQTMHLRITATDSDSVNGSQDDATKSVEYRFGRVRLQNAYGPELLPLDMPFQTEYFTTVGYVVNTADGCTAPTLAGHLQLSNPSTAGGAWQLGTAAMIIGGSTTSATLANIPFIGGLGGLSFSAPGTGNTGYVDVRTQFTTDLPWLLYDWDGDGAFDDEATGRINFGLYKGSPRQIYLRERY